MTLAAAARNGRRKYQVRRRTVGMRPTAMPRRRSIGGQVDTCPSDAFELN